MSDLFNAFEMSPVPAPAEDARPPEPFRGIYGMPMFVTVPTRDLEGSAEFWAEGFGFFTLFDIPGKLVHLRRWAFQDVLLVPAGDESVPADGNAAPAASAASSTPEIAGIPRVAVSFSCVLSQIETIAETCDRLIPGCVRGPRTEIGPLPARDRSDSARPTRRRDAHDELEGESRMPHLRTSGEQQPRGSTTDLDTESDRSRAEVRPISTRRATDLDASFDRSRRGSGPISTRVSTDFDAEADRSRCGNGPISAFVALGSIYGDSRVHRGPAQEDRPRPPLAAGREPRGRR